MKRNLFKSLITHEERKKCWEEKKAIPCMIHTWIGTGKNFVLCGFMMEKLLIMIAKKRGLDFFLKINCILKTDIFYTQDI